MAATASRPTEAPHGHAFPSATALTDSERICRIIHLYDAKKGHALEARELWEKVGRLGFKNDKILKLVGEMLGKEIELVQEPRNGQSVKVYRIMGAPRRQYYDKMLVEYPEGSEQGETQQQ